MLRSLLEHSRISPEKFAAIPVDIITRKENVKKKKEKQKTTRSQKKPDSAGEQDPNQRVPISLAGG
jgi:hypothetical protein